MGGINDDFLLILAGYKKKKSFFINPTGINYIQRNKNFEQQLKKEKIIIQQQQQQMNNSQQIHVIIQYFNDTTNSDRQAEYDFCVQATLANENVCKIHCVLEPNTVCPDWLKTHAKYVEKRVESRLT